MASGSESAGSDRGDRALRIGALCGSLRAQSTNKALLEAFARNAPPTMTLDMELSLAALPLFNPDLESTSPQAVTDFAERIAACDGLIIASPEYAHGMTGALKNGLDWLVSRAEIPNKPVMLVHASSRSNTSREHLREVLGTMSCSLYDGREFVFHLISKTPEEAATLLDEASARREMRDTLERFAAFIGSAGANPE